MAARATEGGEGERRRERRGLLALLALAAALRVGWWGLYTDVIENEGVEYARLAANWLHGRGYVSVFGGTHTLFPPLYPLAIGLAAPLAGSEEAAARLVSLVSGVALVGAVAALARRVFDARVALVAGALAACHPLLVALSASTYSESLYLALAAFCALAVLRCLEAPSVARAAGVGALAGLAYLTRPEGIALAVAFAGLLFAAGVARRSGAGAAAARAGAVLALAGLVAAPYVVHLSRIAGGFRWEGKSWMNNAVAARKAEGLPLGEAARGLGPDAEPRGPHLFADQHARMALPPEQSGGGIADVLLADPLGRARELAAMVVRAQPLGSPLLLALAAIGVAATPWWRTRLFEGLVLLALPGLALAVLLALQFTWERFLFPILPAALVWAAAGADALGRAAGAVAARGPLPARVRALVAPAATAALAAGLLALAARSVSDVGDLRQTRNADVRAAGERIAADWSARSGGDARPRIAGIGLALAHYAGAEILYLPAADEARALLYLRRAAPDYVVLRESERHQTPYAGAWFSGRLADPCAEPLEPPPGALGRYRLWRWTCPKEHAS